MVCPLASPLNCTWVPGYLLPPRLWPSSSSSCLFLHSHISFLSTILYSNILLAIVTYLTLRISKSTCPNPHENLSFLPTHLPMYSFWNWWHLCLLGLSRNLKLHNYPFLPLQLLYPVRHVILLNIHVKLLQTLPPLLSFLLCFEER